LVFIKASLCARNIFQYIVRGSGTIWQKRSQNAKIVSITQILKLAVNGAGNVMIAITESTLLLGGLDFNADRYVWSR